MPNPAFEIGNLIITSSRQPWTDAAGKRHEHLVQNTARITKFERGHFHYEIINTICDIDAPPKPAKILKGAFRPDRADRLGILKLHDDARAKAMKQFPDFDNWEIYDAALSGLRDYFRHDTIVDLSWRNDACPSIGIAEYGEGEVTVQLWIGYKDRDAREERQETPLSVSATHPHECADDTFDDFTALDDAIACFVQQINQLKG